MEAFVEKHFKRLLGKIYQTEDETLILALKKEGNMVMDKSILDLIPESQRKDYPLS